MTWGLTQGMLGTEHESLAPSLAALGPNRYLSQRDFFWMLGVALLVHLAVFGIASLMPEKEVTNIPVRALSFKLGDQDRIAAYSPVAAPTNEVAAPVMQAMAEARVAATTPQPPQPVAQPKPAPKPVKQQPPKPAPAPVFKPIIDHPMPAPQQPAPPAIAPVPQQYIREVGQPAPLAPLPTTAGTPEGAVGGAGTLNTQTEETSREIRERYEQQISSWIQRHKLYPADAGGRAGRVVVRMRIDRGGTVRYYALDESSGVHAIDNAALDMIRRANPVPAAPVNYPAGSLIEFLIPITFQAPQ